MMELILGQQETVQHIAAPHRKRTPQTATDWPRTLARTYFAMLSQRYVDDCLHVLTDPDAFDSEEALYDRRTVLDGSQDGGDLDGIFPRTSTGPGGETIEMPCELEQVHAPSRAISFLDWKIAVDPVRRRIMTSVHDKRRDMECYKNSRTFPHAASMLPWRTKLLVLTTQFQRYARRESTMYGLLQETATYAARMILADYPASRVLAEARKFRKYWPNCAAGVGRYRDFEAKFSRLVYRRVGELSGR